MEPFKVPKCLPCIHTLCLDCLEKYGVGELPGDEMACPICQQKFTIPPGGFKALPKNIFIEQIAANPKLLMDGSPGSGVQCDGCKKLDAKNYCVECAVSLCETCSAAHSNLPMTRSHKVVSLSEKEGSQVYMRALPTYCDNHTEKQLELFCYDCNKAYCVLCLVDHKIHLSTDLKSSSTKLETK